MIVVNMPVFDFRNDITVDHLNDGYCYSIAQIDLATEEENDIIDWGINVQLDDVKKAIVKEVGTELAQVLIESLEKNDKLHYKGEEY